MLVEVDRLCVAGADPGARSCEALVQVAQAGRLSRARQLRAREGLGVLRIGDLLARELGERGELAPAPLAGRDGDLLVDVVGEELKRSTFAVLLALEQHGHER